MAISGLIVILALIAAPATDSGLIVFLPLVAAFVGAIIGAWANSWYRDREAKKAEDRELSGQMVLIFAEYVSNDALLAAALNSTVDRAATIASWLETSVWDQSQTRLAQLLPAQNEVIQIVRYYGLLKLVRDDLTLEPQTGSHDLSAKMKESIGDLRSKGDVVSKLALKYIDDPHFLKPTQQQQADDVEETSPT